MEPVAGLKRSLVVARKGVTVKRAVQRTGLAGGRSSGMAAGADGKAARSAPASRSKRTAVGGDLAVEVRNQSPERRNGEGSGKPYARQPEPH